jgi:hypothetical protein
MKLDRIFEEIGKRFYEIETKHKRTANEENEMNILNELRTIVIKYQ